MTRREVSHYCHRWHWRVAYLAVIPPLTLKESRNVELLNINFISIISLLAASSPHLHIHSLLDISSIWSMRLSTGQIFRRSFKTPIQAILCVLISLFLFFQSAAVASLHDGTMGCIKPKLAKITSEQSLLYQNVTSLPFAKWHVATNSILFHFHYIVLWI